jgi:uncharacterized protein YybS (DUF2232 family)
MRNASFGKEVLLNVTATLLCFCTVLFVPIMGFVAGVFTAFPSALFFSRWGAPKGFWVPGGAAVLGPALFVAMGTPQSIPYYLSMLLMGLVLGYGTRSQWSVEKTVAAASLLVYAIGGALFLSTQMQEGQNPIQVIEEDLRRSFLVAIQEAGGVSQEVPLLEDALQRLVPLMAKLAPGGVLASLLIISWLNLLILRRYRRLHKPSFAVWDEWSRWKAPEHLVWGVIASGFVLFLPAAPALKTVSLNVLVVLGTVYLLQGMAVLGFYFDRWKVPRFLRALLYGLVLLQQIATLLAIFMGLFDMWFDFRRLSQKSNSTA